MKSQIRALLKAANGQDLRVMLPMVTEVHEVRRARVIIDHENGNSDTIWSSIAAKIFKLGAMIEVSPQSCFQLDELMNEVDFVSVGSNDLFQFMMASDRGNSTYCQSI